MNACSLAHRPARTLLAATSTATLVFALAGCATPNFMSSDYRAVGRGNDLVQEGVDLVKKGDWPAAEKKLNAAITTFNQQHKYNADSQIARAYASLAKAEVHLGKCEAAGFSLRSAVNLELLSPGVYGSAESRQASARSYIQAVPHCTLSNGETLQANAERFMNGKLPQLGVAVADIERRRAEAEAERAQRRAEEKAEWQALLGTTQTAAGQLAAQRTQREAVAAAEQAARQAAALQAAEQERQRRATALAAANAPTPHTPSYSLLPQPDTTPNTASQMRSGDARSIGGGTSNRQQVGGSGTGLVAVASPPPTAQPATVEVSARGEYVLLGGFNAYRVHVDNRSAVRGNCLVQGSYRYVSDTDGQTRPHTETQPLVVPAHGRAAADFRRGDRNISMGEWRVLRCTPM